MQKSLGERWVRHIGKNAHYASPRLLFCLGVVALLLGFVLPETDAWFATVRSEWFLAALLFATALISFERKHFYRIIEEQRNQIERLKFNTRVKK